MQVHTTIYWSNKYDNFNIFKWNGACALVCFEYAYEYLFFFILAILGIHVYNDFDIAIRHRLLAKITTNKNMANCFAYYFHFEASRLVLIFIVFDSFALIFLVQFVRIFGITIMSK